MLQHICPYNQANIGTGLTKMGKEFGAIKFDTSYFFSPEKKFKFTGEKKENAVTFTKAISKILSCPLD